MNLIKRLFGQRKHDNVEFAAKLLISELDKNFEPSEVKSIYIWYDFNNHKKREIHVEYGGNLHVIKTDQKNENYKHPSEK